MELIIGKQNTLSYVFTVSGSTGTIVVSGEQEWDLGMYDINRVYDTTNGNAKFGVSSTTTFSFAYSAGLKTWTWSFTNLPVGSTTGDTLLIYLNVNPQQANIALLQYQKA